MLRLFGSILILLACTGFGFSKSQDMQKHLEQLEEIKKLFYLLRSELQYTRAPFAEVFEKIGRKSSEPFRKWLLTLSKRLREKTIGSFWEIWIASIDAELSEEHLKTSFFRGNHKGCFLKQDELEELRSVGKNFEYMESLDLYIEQLEYEIKNVREAYQSKRKLCRSMGIMGGIFLVILLL